MACPEPDVDGSRTTTFVMQRLEFPVVSWCTRNCLLHSVTARITEPRAVTAAFRYEHTCHACIPCLLFLASQLPVTIRVDGACPPVANIGICVNACLNDQDCPAAQKCCFNGCGHTCMAAGQVQGNEPQGAPLCLLTFCFYFAYGWLSFHLLLMAERARCL